MQRPGGGEKTTDSLLGVIASVSRFENCFLFVVFSFFAGHKLHLYCRTIQGGPKKRTIFER